MDEEIEQQPEIVSIEEVLNDLFASLGKGPKGEGNGGTNIIDVDFEFGCRVSVDDSRKC